MNKVLHRALIIGSALLIVGVLGYLLHLGASYYVLPIETRFFHPLYNTLKPSGIYGHAYGIFGTLLMLIGLFSYMARKRLRFMYTWGTLKNWLDVHMTLCTLGTLLIVFHTSFKFGGIISIGFWSLLLVWFSGIIGRFIYARIPHTIEGKRLDAIKRLFNHWHYAHVPFALIVLIFLVIHVVVVLYLGYTWIF